jgi:chorismate mutase
VVPVQEKGFPEGMMMEGLKTVPLADWGIFPADKPWLIAGPCSVESELQIAETARQLKASLGDRLGVLRAGVWKLRTHPGGFEGVGAESLPWLLRFRINSVR